jgi:hypothetical protein
MIAGACSDHATGALVGVQTEDARVGAPQLEGSGALQVLALEVHRHTDEIAQRVRRLHQGDADDVTERLAGTFDVSQRDGRPVDRPVGCHVGHSRRLLSRRPGHPTRTERTVSTTGES